MKRILVFPAIIFLAVLTACSSCDMDPEVVSIWGGDLSVPKLLGVETESPTTLLASFSAPVTILDSSVVVPDSGADSSRSARWECGGGENCVRFTLNEKLGIGTHAVLAAMVADSKGNSLSFSVPVTAFNDHVPKLRINEVRMAYSKPKVEYVELYALSDGNLSGVEISCAMDTADPAYEFPAAEVRAGDYIVYHLRSVEEGLVDETGALDASAGTDARPFARDFWNTLSKSPLKPTNVILVRARKGGKILDALLCAETGVADWPDALRSAVDEAVASGAWKPGSSIQDATVSSGSTATRTIGRNALSDDTDTAADWSICATGKCSPGAVNKTP